MTQTKQAQRAASGKTLTRDARLAAQLCAGWNSRLAARRITAFLDARLKPTGFSIAQFGLLTQIASAADDTLGGLAEKLGLEQSTLSRNLRQLEAQGWVEIATVERDQRRRAVWLTERGARKLEAALPVWRKAHAALDAQLDTQIMRRLADAAEKLK